MVWPSSTKRHIEVIAEPAISAVKKKEKSESEVSTKKSTSEIQNSSITNNKLIEVNHG